MAERGCNASPDGMHFFTFAAKENNPWTGNTGDYFYVVVCRYCGAVKRQELES